LHKAPIIGPGWGGRRVELMLLYHSLPRESRARNLQVQVARPLRIQQQPRQAQRQHQQLSASPLRQQQLNQGRQLHHPRMQQPRRQQ
jgi:hypothetical protein